LALAMYRGLLLGPGNLDQQPDGSWPKPSYIPTGFPMSLNTLLQRTLSSPVDETARAAPVEWVTALRHAFLLNDRQFDDAALRALDKAADQNRPQPTIQFQPLPPVPPPIRPVPRVPPPRAVPMRPPAPIPLPMLPVKQPKNSPSAVLGMIAAGVGVIVVGVLVINGIFANSGSTPTSAGNIQALSTYVPPTAQPSYIPPSTYSSTYTTTTTSTTTAQEDPEALLRQQSQVDSSAVEALVGQWVPQLSSKAVGTQDNGILYDNAAILSHYRTLKSQYPSALLLLSDSYSTFKKQGYWVIVLAQGYGTGAEANTWCASAGLDANNCFAKLISHTAGPQGATLNR
jgi:hypothetical protein